MSTILHSSTLGCFSTSRRVAPCWMIGVSSARRERAGSALTRIVGTRLGGGRLGNAPLRRPR